MALHRDIFWIGRQWAVTGLGMQAINQKLGGQFDVEIARLWDDGWLDVLRAQPWLNAEDFAKGLAVARARHPEPPNGAPPPLPVEALLRAAAPEPRPIPEPIAPKVVEPAKPAASPDAEPEVVPVVVQAIAPAKPAPSFLQMNIAEHSGRLLRVWRVRRRTLD
jgi:hypothetical protein